jgi:hypothetical protein
MLREVVDGIRPQAIAGQEETRADSRRLRERPHEQGVVETRAPALDARRGLALVERLPRGGDELDESGGVDVGEQRVGGCFGAGRGDEAAEHAVSGLGREAEQRGGEDAGGLGLVVRGSDRGESLPEVGCRTGHDAHAGVAFLKKRAWWRWPASGRVAPARSASVHATLSTRS